MLLTGEELGEFLTWGNVLLVPQNLDPLPEEEPWTQSFTALPALSQERFLSSAYSIPTKLLAGDSITAIVASVTVVSMGAITSKALTYEIAFDPVASF